MNHEDTKARRGFGDASDGVIGACIEVHKTLGPGLLESIYEECLCRELTLLGISYRRQVDVPLEYKGVQLDAGYRLDVIVEESLILEIKAVEQLLPVHAAQLLSYLKLTGIHVGLLVNFRSATLRAGLRRIVL